MKKRLIAGTINHRANDEEWENVHLDISSRGIYDENQGRARFVPPDVVADLSDGLPMFDRDTFDEVRLNHVLEHLPLEPLKLTLAAVFRVLKPGGVADIEVPDMDAVCKAWVDGQYTRDQLQQWIFGEQLKHHEPGDSHRYGFWEERLRELLHAAGFVAGERIDAGLGLHLLAQKP
jgi:ubiquinone/menaquinone biosynthesis C-methylase UbiE